MMIPMVVFSDLDGTLLDAETYSFEPAGAAIELLAQSGIPLIFCTSKTRLETEHWRRTMANVHPFIIENGGAICVPEGYFGTDVVYDKHDGGYGILEFGRPYPELRRSFEEIRASIGLPLRGFGDMTVEEIAGRCGFTCQDAALAATREYDEPFTGIEAGTLPQVVQEAGKRGLQVVAGSRFHHLFGGSDKGRAVRTLRSLYEVTRGRVSAIAVGDGANDEPMLRAVDHPVLVRKPDGSLFEAVDLPGLIIAPRPGPAGFRDIILALLRYSV